MGRCTHKSDHDLDFLGSKIPPSAEPSGLTTAEAVNETKYADWAARHRVKIDPEINHMQEDPSIGLSPVGRSRQKSEKGQTSGPGQSDRRPE